MRFGLPLLFVAAVSPALTAHAIAQSCHETPVTLNRSRDTVTAVIRLRSQFASVSGGGFTGFTPQAGIVVDRWALHVSLPTYQSERNDVQRGIGDVAIESSLRIVQRDHATAALAMTLTAPSGDSAKSFGMGHWMIMPSAAGSWQQRQFTTTLMAGISKSLGDSSHHHHGGSAFPLVNPMNAFEGNVLMRVSYHATAHLAPELLGSAAVAFGSGENRGQAGAGASASFGQWLLHFDAQTGLLNKPFTARITVDLGVTF
jgi:hypothetical protein